MASEPTFDPWKVEFSWGKVSKRALAFESLWSAFQNLHFWNPHIKSDNLAKTESLPIFVEQKLSPGPMWWCHQNGWIFGKVPNALWYLPPSFLEDHIALFLYFHSEVPYLRVRNPKICSKNFRVQNDPPPLELFRKFIRLETPPVPNI